MIALLSSSEFVRALVAALVHFIWQGCLIAAALWVALMILPRAHAASRHAAACTALVLMAAAPVTTFSFIYSRSTTPIVDNPPDFHFDLPSRPPSTIEMLIVFLFIAWALGVLLLSLRLAGGMWRLRMIVRRYSTPLDDDWTMRAERIARRIGINRRIQWKTSNRIDVPMTLGWLRPIILIPCSVLTDLSPTLLEAIIAHELAHVKRYDYLVNMIQSVLEVALFYHPCVFWVSNQVRMEREYCCDDMAISLGHDRLLYARALAELEGLRPPHTLPALASTGGSLMVRIKRIVKPNPKTNDNARTMLAPVLVLGAMVALSSIGAAACGAASNELQKKDPKLGAELAQAIGIRWLPPAIDPWKSLIASAASKHNVDPDVLAIVMLVESSGNPDAESPAGAVGLMQIMPKTAESIAMERNIGNFAVDQLKEPQTNVDFGAWFLARQFDTFGKNLDKAQAIELAAAAYNGGTERVRQYLAGTQELSEETASYKKLVAGMWSERGAEESATYRQWRERIRRRAAERATAPVSGARVSMPYGETTNPFSGKKERHSGIDLAKEAGTPVLAPLKGVVRSAATEGDRGNTIVIDHPGGLQTRYHHLGDLNVAPGQTISKGEKIGTVGSTGKSTGPHVHFEVRDNGEPIDPSGYVGTSPAP